MRMKYSSFPLTNLHSWASLNNVQFNGVQIEPHILTEDSVDKGGGLLATQNHEACDVLLTIPRDLVLNKTSIEDACRTDKRLQVVLQAVSTKFSQTPRIAVMIFLLLQLTYSSPDTGRNIVVNTPLTDYAKFLPKDVPLPVMYTSTEQELLTGTSLEAALKQKLSRLQQEFDHLKSVTQDIDWCRNLWWDERQGILSLSDWKVVDAMYRSRALELPHGVGDSMVPVLDMANHASGGTHNARFQPDSEGNVQLVVRDDMSIKAGDEITIMYGCGGACEMIFSYGFLETDTQSAREIFLDLDIPTDDPLRRAKVEFVNEAPGVRLFTDNEQHTRWESSFVWWACVNEEDGLDFKVLHQVDGTMELEASWKGTTFKASDLRGILSEDALWSVFQLRAVVLIQNRVERQGMELSLYQEDFDAVVNNGVGGPTVDAISKLRDLEMELLASSHQALENEKARLLDSDTVRTYLNHQDPDRTDGANEDFS